MFSLKVAEPKIYKIISTHNQPAFRLAVDLRQVVAQVAELTTAKTEVTARRATLPA